MPSGRERLARQQIAQAAAPPDLMEAGQAKVTAVSGASPPVVTISYLGGSYQVSHLLQYTPVVGHVVAVCRYAGSYLILGRPGGFPS